MAANDHLVIFFHGIGASGAQLMPLAATWRRSMPRTSFRAPDAPFHHPRGHQWFAVDGSQLMPGRITIVREAFDQTVSEIVRQEGFDYAHDRVAFIGVSQGAIVALDAVASGRWQIGALVSFAGLLPPTPVTGISAATPVLLVHGSDDRTIPAIASTMAARQLEAAGFKIELEVLPNLGHTVSPEGADRAHEFLQSVFIKSD